MPNRESKKCKRDQGRAVYGLEANRNYRKKAVEWTDLKNARKQSQHDKLLRVDSVAVLYYERSGETMDCIADKFGAR